MRRLSIWAPPLVWMAVILWFSSDLWSASHTGAVMLPLFGLLLPWATPADVALLHGIVRKTAHLTEYAILALLWRRALRRGVGAMPVPPAAAALVVSIVWAAIDELHQSTVPSRTASVNDVGIDTIGAALGLALAGLSWRAVDRVTGGLLWLAAIGGIAILIVDRIADVRAGALWLTTPAAIAVLAVRWWLRRRRRDSHRVESPSAR